MKNLSLELEEGKILTLLGKSGGGKSTLLKCVYGLVDLQKGTIEFNDEQVLGPAYNLIPGYKDMKLVSQEYYVLENNTVKENITDLLAGYTNEYKNNRANQVLRAVELSKYADKKAKELSSGQRQRLSIARALAEFPKLLLLDEPFSNLDFGKRDKLFSFIRENLVKNNSSCIFVTHHPQEALRYADEVMIMEEGSVKASGDPVDLYRNPNDLETGKLFGKCFELTKKDLDLTKGIPLKKGSILLRPENIKIVSKAAKNIHLTATVKDCFFAGEHYELKLKTESGKLIYCYSANDQYKTGNLVHLSVHFHLK
ncbi:MAG TPA: ABC transporter ATP-binding protein [Bacteroidia bacterium]